MAVKRFGVRKLPIDCCCGFSGQSVDLSGNSQVHNAQAARPAQAAQAAQAARCEDADAGSPSMPTVRSVAPRR